MEWFEDVERYVHLEPEQFAYSLLTGSQRIGYENLKLRDAGYDGTRGNVARRKERSHAAGSADVHALYGPWYVAQDSCDRFAMAKDGTPGARNGRRGDGGDVDDVPVARRADHIGLPGPVE